MSTTITYKGDTLTTVENNTKVLKTAGKYMEGDVTLTDVSRAAPIIQSLNITPSESVQTFNASDVDGYKPVTIEAIDSEYVGSGIPQNDSTDLTASGATVTAPAGFYASQATKSVSSGSATTPATTISSSPSITISSTGLITATNSKTQSVTPTVSAGYVSSGTAGTITVSGSNTKQMTTKAATTYTPTTTNQTIASGTYLTGIQTIKGDANLIAANILSGKTIFGVSGTASSGLVREQGTYTATSNVTSPTISFSNTHTTAPSIVLFIDSAANMERVNGHDYAYAWLYFNAYDLLGHWYTVTGKSSAAVGWYGFVTYVYKVTMGYSSGTSYVADTYVRSTSKGENNTNFVEISSNDTTVRSATSNYYNTKGYYVQPSYFSPRCYVSYTVPSGTTLMPYKSGRTFDWIAIWAPT